MKQALTQIGVFILVIIILFGVAILNSNAIAEKDKKMWNNGTCLACENGHYELVNISKGRGVNLNSYFYQCDNCKAIIELHNAK